MTRTTLPDHELILLFRNGDSTALTALFKKHTTTIRTVVSGILKKYPTEIDDVVQETQIKVFKGLDQASGSYVENNNFITWVASIARNAAIDTLRQCKSRSIHYIPTYSFDYLEPSQNLLKNTTDDLLWIKYIHSVIEQLPLQMSIILQMHYIKGFTYKEIAESGLVTTRSESTCKGCAKRALDLVREKVMAA